MTDTDLFSARRFRKGKTIRDRAGGYAARRDSNRARRNAPDKKDREWVNCHGKGNSSVPFKLGSRRHRKS
jgi:hypothetical protein